MTQYKVGDGSGTDEDDDDDKDDHSAGDDEEGRDRDDGHNATDGNKQQMVWHHASVRPPTLIRLSWDFLSAAA